MGHFSFNSVREAPRATRLRQDTAENSIPIPSYLFLRTVVLILTVAIEVYDSTGLALEIIDHLAIIDSFFSSVANVVILLCLVELALSFLSALDIPQNHPLLKPRRYQRPFCSSRCSTRR
jgi:anaerobic C4-dicarboxylate transporter